MKSSGTLHYSGNLAIPSYSKLRFLCRRQPKRPLFSPIQGEALDHNFSVRVYQLILAVYRTTSTFPTTELYGLTSKVCRSGALIPANIAEGYGRNGNVELCRFIQIAMGLATVALNIIFYLLKT